MNLFHYVIDGWENAYWRSEKYDLDEVKEEIAYFYHQRNNFQGVPLQIDFIERIK